MTVRSKELLLYILRGILIMMSRTHLTVGIATSLLVMHPQTPKEICLAVAGGALGGVVPDIDILDNDYKFDCLIGQILGYGSVAAVLFLDRLFGYGIMDSIMSKSLFRIIPGLVVFAALNIFGFFQEHRGFTHSILAFLLFAGSVFLIYDEFLIPFSLGFASHIALDLLNKKGLQLFYPLDFGICFYLCYADEGTNNVFMYAGLIASVLLLINSMFIHI